MYGKSVDVWSLGVITYILICGYPPFHDDNQSVLFRLIQSGKYQFESPYWDLISDDAKDLIRHMLQIDVKLRYTAEQVLGHPWMTGEVSTTDISGTTLHEMKKFQAKRRWKMGIAAVQAANRVRNLTAGKT